MKKLFGSDWTPSIAAEAPAPYFKSKAWELACYFLEFTGNAQLSKLGLFEVEYNNFEMGLIWYKAVEDALRSDDLPEDYISNCLDIARCLLADEAGIEITDKDLARADEWYEEVEEAPTTFTVGCTIKCTTHGSAFTHTVTKRTKCFVWFHDEKRKIKIDANGCEYVEYTENHGKGRTWRWVPA